MTSLGPTSRATVPVGSRKEAMHAIADRLAARKRDVASVVLERARREIVDYQSPPDPDLLEDELMTALGCVEVLVASLQGRELALDDQLIRSREIAGRRVRQGVPLEAFLRASRLWASVCWEAVLNLAATDLPEEREAALEVASRIFDLADWFATSGTNAYLDEVADRGLLRRDLLDALLSGNGASTATARLATRLHLRLNENYVVVVVHGEGLELEEARQEPPAARSELDQSIEQTRRNVRPRDGALLTGMRNGDLVVLYPASTPADLASVRHDCQNLAIALGGDVSIGMSGWHEGRGALGAAYAEARDAVAIAARRAVQGRAVSLDEVLVDHMLDSSVSAHRILEDVLRPLLVYDASRNAALLPTLRAYLQAGLNISKAAVSLFVNPNTVVYRLRRVRELTGRDPHDADDLLVLFLAIKLADLRSGE